MDSTRESFVPGLLLDGRFEILAPLNHGSFGMVFKARDSLTNQIVALKCLAKPSSGASTPSSPFSIDERSEEKACHELLGAHPHLVNMLHSFETDNHSYLVLEFCSNGDLYEAIRLARGPLETRHVRNFMLQLVDAVQYMHDKGMYHRDIKPENIFLTQSGSMKLGDFGLATRDTWTTEVAVGSDRYMSPEQYDSHGAGYDPAKADIWAIGICLLNILFARNPFLVPAESDLLYADYLRDNQSLFDVFPTMSQDTFEVLIHCMNLDPKKRSLSAVREALHRAISFTTDDETLDAFCTQDREVVPASANREPLRTPSIQSPQIDQGGSFPWARALHMSPAPRQLSAIPDTESYTEDLFPSSERSSQDWYSIAPETSSLASAWDVSAMGTSYDSPAHPVPQLLSGSVPITTAKPIPSLAAVFGRKEVQQSKSWSDIFDEDQEELQRESEHAQTLRQRREYNSRTWSHESQKDEDVTIRPRMPLADITTPPAVNSRMWSPPGHTSLPFRRGSSSARQNAPLPPATSGFVNENDGFFFEDDDHPSTSATATPRPHALPPYSPPFRRHQPTSPPSTDKWAALGEKRRACHEKGANVASPSSVSPSPSAASDTGKFGGIAAYPPIPGSWRRTDAALGFDDLDDVFERKDPERRWVGGGEPSPRQHRPPASGVFEWVGGWHHHGHLHL
ncbi:MAG: hypothetical protein M1829_006465 [Trizodia sp. TS-e1964]|nr:MAG: hypothetical protein M1829_006465 [Trizodia sp. TS-e1964]